MVTWRHVVRPSVEEMTNTQKGGDNRQAKHGQEKKGPCLNQENTVFMDLQQLCRTVILLAACLGGVVNGPRVGWVQDGGWSASRKGHIQIALRDLAALGKVGRKN
jgi:hypothetical protein